MLAVETVPEARRVVALRVAVAVAERAPVTPLVAHHAVVASDVARALLEVRVGLRVDDDPEVRLLEADLVRVRVTERVRVRVRVRVRARGRARGMARVWVIRLTHFSHFSGCSKPTTPMASVHAASLPALPQKR